MNSKKKNSSVKKVRQKAAITQAVPEHENHNYLFFYSQDSPFSNFYSVSFQDENGVHFFSSEQCMMYGKAVLFGDEEAQVKIMETPTDSSRTCKLLGRRVKNFDEKVWVEHAEKIVENACYHKFTQNRKLKRELLNTGDRELIEAAPNDRR
jgi:ribA/ribD-fused uncharacterized protein